MKIFYYFGHPAQFHFQKLSISLLRQKGHQVSIYIRSKDVLEKLLTEYNFEYINILKNERKSTLIGISWSLLKRVFILGREMRKHKPDLLISSDPSFSQLGFLFGIPCINCIDDDINAIGFYSILTYPFTRIILTPEHVKVGLWHYKRIQYAGYMKLAYLHPNRFIPSINKIGSLQNEKYFLVRLSKLSAHHDRNISGINKSMLKRTIERLSVYGRVFITSESDIDEDLNAYKLSIPASDFHHYLYYSQLLISDSQSVTGEAAVLGIPSIRVSTMVNKLSVLEELEHKYKLTFGLHPENEDLFFKKLDELLSMNNLRQVFQNRRQVMLADKIDIISLMVWFVDNYPESASIMKKNPDYQYIFW